MLVTAAALVIVMLMLMVVTAATLVVMVLMLVLVMMPAAARMVMVLMLVMMTAAALVIVVLMLVVVSTTAVFAVRMVMLLAALPLSGGLVPGIDHSASLHGPGDLGQLFDEGIGVLRRQTELLGGKGDGGLPDRRVIVEFLLDLGGAVGAVQIVDDIYLSGHGNASLYLYMSKYSCVYK